MSTVVYTVGLCYSSVCTDDPDDVMLDVVNRTHPTGIDSRWEIADEPFKSGEPNPCPCSFYTSNRHVLVVC